jgi:hypothetical protein
MGAKGGPSNLPEHEPDPANLTPDELATNQEVRALPWVAGQVKVALRWISPVYKQFTKNAKTSGK